MRLARVFLGLLLAAMGVANVALWSPVLYREILFFVGLVGVGFGIAVTVAGLSTLAQTFARDLSRESIRIARRVALVSLAVATLIAGAAALAIAVKVGSDPAPEFPWIVPFYCGVLVCALLMAPIALWKAAVLEEWKETPPPLRIDDPFDPPEPEEEMIVPDPGPTLHALLARKRSLNLVRAH